MVDPAASHTVPGVTEQGRHVVRQRMAYGDAEAGPIHGCHHATKVVSVIRPTFADIVLPLMDHLVGQCAPHFGCRLIVKQRNREPNQPVIGKGFGGDHRSARPDGMEKQPGRGGEPLTPDDGDWRQAIRKVFDVQVPPPSLKCFRGQHSLGADLPQMASEVTRNLVIANRRREAVTSNTPFDATRRVHSIRGMLPSRFFSKPYGEHMATNDKQVIFSLIGVGRVHPPKRQVLKDIYLSFYYGAKIGVLGANGSGKSTLLRIISGVDKNYTGEITFSKGYSVGLLEQEPQLDSTKTVKEVVQEGRQELMAMLRDYETISEKLGQEIPADVMDTLIEKQGQLQEKIEAVNGWELENQLEVAMDALRCPPADTKVETLSGGEKRRVALCRLLIQEPDILLLDEPTNHLDAESVQWLEQYLQRYKGTVIAVTHDRYFLDNVAGWILELDRGHGMPFEGNYSSWLEQKQARLAKEEKADAKRRKTLERELEWIRMSPKGRHAKGKARLTRYEQLLGEQQEKLAEALESYIPPGRRPGDGVVAAKKLSSS